MSLRRKTAKVLWGAGAVTIDLSGPYVFNQGFLSPIHIDNGLLMSRVGERKQVIDLTVKAVEGRALEFDLIAGVATGEIPHASWISDRLDVPMVYLRSKKKITVRRN